MTYESMTYESMTYESMTYESMILIASSLYAEERAHVSQERWHQRQAQRHSAAWSSLQPGFVQKTESIISNKLLSLPPGSRRFLSIELANDTRSRISITISTKSGIQPSEVGLLQLISRLSSAKPTQSLIPIEQQWDSLTCLQNSAYTSSPSYQTCNPAAMKPSAHMCA